MFFVFFLSTIFSLPIERYACGANINGNLFNITELANNRPNGFDVIREPNRDIYYFKMCGSLKNDDLPPLAPDATDISVMRCNRSSHECASAIPLQSFDWQLLNPYNPDDGVIYYASGEPFIDPEDKQYYTIDFEIKFKCDPNSKSTDIAYDYLLVNKTNEVIVRITFNTSYGCPTKAPAPSPTPTFDPDCSFAYYFNPKTQYGVYTDFKQYNGGPYGIRTNLKLDGNVYKTLFYQPCERMKCPIGYSCSDSEYSSAWLCNQNDFKCESYGLINSDGIDAEIENFTENSSILITHHTQSNIDKSITLRVGCNELYNFDHFSFESQATITNNQLSVNSYSHGACTNYNPKPIPPYSEDTCILEHSSFGLINMRSLNHVDGYLNMVIDDISKKKLSLYFQPCGGLDCPSNSQCDGDTNATVWLCEEVETNQQNNNIFNDCIAYGLIENNLTFTDLSSQLEILYKGDRKRTASVNFKCDKDGRTNKYSIWIPSSISLTGTKLSFDVYSQKFCSKKIITGGAIFLITLAILIVLYIIIGLIVQYVKNGKLAFPNLEFWNEFIACVETGFMFIIKCGHVPRGADANAKYDEIA